MNYLILVVSVMVIGFLCIWVSEMAQRHARVKKALDGIGVVLGFIVFMAFAIGMVDRL